MRMAVDPEHDILVRAARGEKTERTPVWLMRQAGRYMADFRKYSDKLPFRERSETPEIATELSLQCWRAYGMDGVIMFSDILTPLPGFGIEWDVVKGKGPQIKDPIRTKAQVEALTSLGGSAEIEATLGFVGETLRNLRAETEGKTSLLGFIGAPWTLAAYATEGGSSKHCMVIKQMMMKEPELFHTYLGKLAEDMGNYACYQIENGAQVIQVFESWAHQLSPFFFEHFAKPYAQKTMETIKAKHPDVPVIYFANGGSSYLELQKDMKSDMLCVDWAVDMAQARRTLGPDAPISGNIDPMVLLGTEADIRRAVRDCVAGAGGPGNRHVLNLGHGVVQQTPEAAVATLVDAAKALRAEEGALA